jgi:hypothetical protein
MRQRGRRIVHRLQDDLGRSLKHLVMTLADSQAVGVAFISCATTWTCRPLPAG